MCPRSLISLTPRFNPSNLPILKPDLNTVRMKRALGQKVLNHSLRQHSATLIFFKHNHNGHTRRDVFAMLSIHRLFFLLVLDYEPKQRGDHIAGGCDKDDEERHGIVITMDA